MSRTYRRKNTEYRYYSSLVCEDRQSKYGGIYSVYRAMNKSDKEYEKYHAIYHSDSYRRCGIPHWYVNLYCETKLRQATKQELYKIIKYPEHEAFLPKFYKNAGYGWY